MQSNATQGKAKGNAKGNAEGNAKGNAKRNAKGNAKDNAKGTVDAAGPKDIESKHAPKQTQGDIAPLARRGQCTQDATAAPSTVRPNARSRKLLWQPQGECERHTLRAAALQPFSYEGTVHADKKDRPGGPPRQGASQETHGDPEG